MPSISPPQTNNNDAKYAYVTLFSDDSYLPGVLGLYRSLILVKHTYPLIIMYTSSVIQESLEIIRNNIKDNKGCYLRMAKPFLPSCIDHSRYVRPLYAQCWNKLRMWQWTEYKKLIYLDADMMLLKNIDHLFSSCSDECPFYAVGDCYGGRETEEERSVCCHFTPESPPAYFNAGFFVCIPDKDIFDDMNRVLIQGSVQIGRFAEQDFLNGYFSLSDNNNNNNASPLRKWRHLSHLYNAQKRIKYHHPELWDLNKIFVIHYVDEKPWSHRFSEENMAYQDIIEYWFQVYNNITISSDTATSSINDDDDDDDAIVNIKGNKKTICE